jgi:hypothetical protein
MRRSTARWTSCMSITCFARSSRTCATRRLGRGTGLPGVSGGPRSAGGRGPVALRPPGLGRGGTAPRRAVGLPERAPPTSGHLLHVEIGVQDQNIPMGKLVAFTLLRPRPQSSSALTGGRWACRPARVETAWDHRAELVGADHAGLGRRDGGAGDDPRPLEAKLGSPAPASTRHWSSWLLPDLLALPGTLIVLSDHLAGACRG